MSYEETRREKEDEEEALDDSVWRRRDTTLTGEEETQTNQPNAKKETRREANEKEGCPRKRLEVKTKTNMKNSIIPPCEEETRFRSARERHKCISLLRGRDLP